MPDKSQASLPARPSLKHPDVLLATWFGSGYLRPAPGTWGSLAALPFAWAIQVWFGAMGLLLAALGVYALGLWATAGFTRRSARKDPGEVVIDEVAGVWITFALAVPLAELLAIPLAGGTGSPLYFFIGFALFRLFDIAKPFPIGWLDRRVGGATGVMIDDVVAGLFAAIGLVAVQWAAQHVTT